MVWSSPFCPATNGRLRCVSYHHGDDEGINPAGHDWQPISSTAVRQIEKQEQLDARLDPDTPSPRILAQRLDAQLAEAQALVGQPANDNSVVRGQVDTGKVLAGQMMGVEQLAPHDRAAAPNYNNLDTMPEALPYQGTNGMHGSEFPKQVQERNEAIAEQIIEERDAILAAKNESTEPIQDEGTPGPGEDKVIQNVDPVTNTGVVESTNDGPNTGS